MPTPTRTLPDGPRERLAALGPRALSCEELLALVLGSGVCGFSARQIARSLLAAYGSLRELGRATPSELARCPGVGPTHAARVSAALELGRRREVELRPPSERIRGAADIYARYATQLRDQPQESFHVLLLDSRGVIRAEREVTRGTLDGSLVHPREIFAPAVREAAASVVLVHNHPSGDPTPSEEDILITMRLVDAGRIVGIPVLDHVVIGEGSYVSFAEKGMLESSCR
ncbi:MAG: DNA repair protein RadC [Planctomycetes bacterium]|nr:DNA repair protein RadC [Planctomycetota bacterium]